MIYAGLASQEWPDWASHRTWRTKSSITKLAQSLGLRPSINGGNGVTQPTVDVKSLHAKIGALTLENDS
jgi:hypothetical protein